MRKTYICTHVLRFLEQRPGDRLTRLRVGRETWKTGPELHKNRKRTFKRGVASGYLLMEVLLALAILSIVVVMVFQIIQTTLKVTADINFQQTATAKSRWNQ